MSDCVFCKIISWEIDAVKIREDENFIAILDVFPNRKWMTLLIPKKHYDSDIFNIDDSFLSNYIISAKKVANILKKWLNVDRVLMVVEWLEVPHAHIKLYPYIKWWKLFADWFLNWPMVDIKYLEDVKKEILENN